MDNYGSLAFPTQRVLLYGGGFEPIKAFFYQHNIQEIYALTSIVCFDYLF